MRKSRWAISYKDIYDNYNYDSLNYLIDIMNGFYSAVHRKSKKMHLTGQLEEKKIQMIRFEIISENSATMLKLLVHLSTAFIHNTRSLEENQKSFQQSVTTR